MGQMVSVKFKVLVQPYRKYSFMIRCGLVSDEEESWRVILECVIWSYNVSAHLFFKPHISSNP